MFSPCAQILPPWRKLVQAHLLACIWHLVGNLGCCKCWARPLLCWVLQGWGSPHFGWPNGPKPPELCDGEKGAKAAMAAKHHTGPPSGAMCTQGSMGLLTAMHRGQTSTIGCPATSVAPKHQPLIARATRWRKQPSPLQIGPKPIANRAPCKKQLPHCQEPLVAKFGGAWAPILMAMGSIAMFVLENAPPTGDPLRVAKTGGPLLIDSTL